VARRPKRRSANRNSSNPLNTDTDDERHHYVRFAKTGATAATVTQPIAALITVALVRPFAATGGEGARIPQGG
jgi:hypothetical protein